MSLRVRNSSLPYAYEVVVSSNFYFVFLTYYRIQRVTGKRWTTSWSLENGCLLMSILWLTRWIR